SATSSCCCDRTCDTDPPERPSSEAPRSAARLRGFVVSPADGSSPVPNVAARAGDRTWLIAIAASLWGFSSLLRDPLSQQLPALTIVVLEHLVLVLLVCPWVVPAVRAVARSSLRTKLSVLV